MLQKRTENAIIRPENALFRPVPRRGFLAALGALILRPAMALTRPMQPLPQKLELAVNLPGGKYVKYVTLDIGYTSVPIEITADICGSSVGLESYQTLVFTPDGPGRGVIFWDLQPAPLGQAVKLTFDSAAPFKLYDFELHCGGIDRLNRYNFLEWPPEPWRKRVLDRLN